jgi:hypothetical protein
LFSGQKTLLAPLGASTGTVARIHALLVETEIVPAAHVGAMMTVMIGTVTATVMIGEGEAALQTDAHAALCQQKTSTGIEQEPHLL